jgi:hypothetical protein
MKIRKQLLALAGLLSSALAGVAFVAPAPGAVIPGATFTVTWKDNGAAPAIADLAGYSLELWTGSNAAPVSAAVAQAYSYAILPKGLC